nr:MAG TPA: hypothetical protein [Caudoviricetes sp.]
MFGFLVYKLRKYKSMTTISITPFAAIKVKEKSLSRST